MSLATFEQSGRLSGLRPGMRSLTSAGAARAAMLLDAGAITLSCLAGNAGYHLLVLGTPPEPARALATAVAILCLFLPLAGLKGLYDAVRLTAMKSQIRTVAWLWGGIFLFFASAAFALGVGKEFSRGTMMSTALLGFAALTANRLVWRHPFSSAVAAGGLAGRRALLICDSGPAGVRALERDFTAQGFAITSRFPWPQRAQAGRPDNLRWKQAILQAAREQAPEEIIIACAAARWDAVRGLVEDLRILPLKISFVPHGAAAEMLRKPVQRIGNTIALELHRQPLSGLEQGLKRGVDVAGALAGLILAAPLLLLVAAAIKLDSRGPVIFRQRRPGFCGRPFMIYKFRTMHVAEDGPNIVQARRQDPRVTRLGAWLRRSSIDELPQLLNVLRGEMSLIGPRPHALAHDAFYLERIASYAFRQHVKPGITGLAQVNGSRGETPTIASMERRIAFDLWYIDNWSIWLDLRIAALTILVVISGRNAF